MKLSVSDYLEQLANAKVKEVAATTVEIQQLASLHDGLAFIADQLDAGFLAAYQWNVSGEDEEVAVRLETNLINVPMAEAGRLDPKLIAGDDPQPVNVYLVMEAEHVNASHLRIDLLNTADEFAEQPDQSVMKAQQWVSQHLAAVKENQEKATEAAKKPKKTRKTTHKKTATRRRRTKKASK
ncbi:hypothetical protein [uncultured Limosilactobacillus sp.]|uniref:hypothetical protein n=1 Tax=uncultured Limosilactobacillus sp. TaxID=2837629 RepID=UPI0025FD002A|nr:hypothetical protein [uncultured Limosilactobacillus sp.]